MDAFIDALVRIGGPGAILIAALVLALRWLDKRETKCDERLRAFQERHTQYVEEQTKTVTKALVENTHSNHEIAEATRELTQSLSGKHSTQR